MVVNIKGKYNLTVTGDVNIDSKGSLNITSIGNSKLQTGPLNITSSGNIDITSVNTTINSALTKISSTATFPVLRLSPDLDANLRALSAVTGITLNSIHFNPQIIV